MLYVELSDPPIDDTMASSDSDVLTTWYAVQSEKHQQEYYFNPITGESTWVLPSNRNYLMSSTSEESEDSMDPETDRDWERRWTTMCLRNDRRSA
jgi:WW domain